MGTSSSKQEVVDTYINALKKTRTISQFAALGKHVQVMDSVTPFLQALQQLHTEKIKISTTQDTTASNVGYSCLVYITPNSFQVHGTTLTIDTAQIAFGSELQLWAYGRYQRILFLLDTLYSRYGKMKVRITLKNDNLTLFSETLGSNDSSLFSMDWKLVEPFLYKNTIWPKQFFKVNVQPCQVQLKLFPPIDVSSQAITPKLLMIVAEENHVAVTVNGKKATVVEITPSGAVAKIDGMQIVFGADCASIYCSLNHPLLKELTQVVTNVPKFLRIKSSSAQVYCKCDLGSQGQIFVKYQSNNWVLNSNLFTINVLNGSLVLPNTNTFQDSTMGAILSEFGISATKFDNLEVLKCTVKVNQMNTMIITINCASQSFKLYAHADLVILQNDAQQVHWYLEPAMYKMYDKTRQAFCDCKVIY